MGGRYLEILPGAMADFREARAWYSQRSPNVAANFAAEVAQASRIILESPKRWPRFKRGTRRYILRQFPYLVVYRVFDDRVVIVAYQHGMRRSGFWRAR